MFLHKTDMHVVPLIKRNPGRLAQGLLGQPVREIAADERGRGGQNIVHVPQQFRLAAR